MRSQSGFWRKCRIGFRWCRISILLLVLVIICVFVRFNRIGLPDFLKKPLVEKLHAHGIDAEFSRLRLSLVRGFIADNVRLSDARIPSGPVLLSQELQLQPDFDALLHRRLEVSGLVLRRGKLIWPLSPTNALALEDIQADLRFQTNDTWSLDNFHADFHGAKLALSGDIAHASEMSDWEMFQEKKTGGRANLQLKLQQFSDALKKIHFDGAPQLNLTINGDARDLHSFIIHLRAQVPSVRTVFDRARDLELTVDLTAPADAPTNFNAAWSFWTNAQPYQLVWSARLADLRSEKLNAGSVSFNGSWHAPKLTVGNLSADLGNGQFAAAGSLNVATRELVFTNSSCFDFHLFDSCLPEKIGAQFAEISWGQPPALRVGGALILPAWTNRAPGWSEEMRRTVNLAGELALTNGSFRNVDVDRLQTRFSYSSLVLRLSDLKVVRAKSRLQFDGGEDDATKIFWGRLRGRFDVDAIRPYLTESNAVNGMDHFTFTAPLALDVNLRGRLNDYDSIGVNGHVALTNFAIRLQSMGSVAGDFSYTNRLLEFFHPRLTRENGAQTLTADTVALNFENKLIYITNGFGTADPVPLMRAIGPKVAHIIEPYHFLRTPTANINGRVSMREVKNIHDVDDADLRFDILSPVPFEWLKLKTPGIQGTIHWLGETLILTNVTGAFYGGEGNGFANFDFRPAHQGADYEFTVVMTNVNLHSLAADLSTSTNADHLEGALTGKLVVTHADTRELQSWDGFGHLSLRDGLLWDIPIFGILSPVLNTISPGLGNSRATDASARFTMTNGVIFTDSLEISSVMARLSYTGTVDLEQNVNARVTAQLLRNTWAIGPLISTVLWPVSKLFEYKVSGTLKDPKATPVYVPKILLMPFHPIRSIEKIFPAGGNSTNTPAGN